MRARAPDLFCWVNPLIQGNPVRGMFAISPTDVWAVGNGGLTPRTVAHMRAVSGGLHPPTSGVVPEAAAHLGHGRVLVLPMGPPPLSPLLLALALAGCLPQVGPRLDGGTPPPGSDGGPDAGCLGPAECTSGVCTAGHCAAPFDPCAPSYSGCGTSVDWVDVAADAGPVQVRFPAGGENNYSPQCVRLHLGQQVSFQGSFGSHPLDQGCGPLPGVVPTVESGSSPVVVTFDSALGTFGYYCQNHGSPSGGGMAGAIQVVK